MMLIFYLTKFAVNWRERKTYTKSQLLRRCDLVIILGGDGTLLKTAREIGLARPLIAGVNMGHLGFLTAFTTQKFLTSLPKIFKTILRR